MGGVSQEEGAEAAGGLELGADLVGVGEGAVEVLAGGLGEEEAAEGAVLLSEVLAQGVELLEGVGELGVGVLAEEEASFPADFEANRPHLTLLGIETMDEWLGLTYRVGEPEA